MPFARFHASAIIASILYGLVLTAPLVSRGHQEIVNDEHFYLSRIQDVIDGHPFLSNAYLAEHKDGLPQQLFLAEFLLAQPLRLFHIDVAVGRVMYTGVLGFVVFGLVYTIFYVLSKRRFFALGCTLTLMVGFMMMRMLRPVSPQFNIIFFLTQFLFLWKAIESSASKKWLVASGINLGLLFYIYPYYWTYYVVLIVLLMLKDRRMGWVLGIAGVISIPYWYLTYLASRAPEYAESLSRIGLISSRFPSGINVIMWSLPVLLALLWGVRTKRISLEPHAWLCGVALVSSMIVVNQHLITGKNMEFSSHYIVGAIMIAFFAIAYIVRNVKKSWIAIVGLFFVVRGIWIFAEQGIFVTRDSQVYPAGPVIAWIDAHVARDQVVFADDDLADLIPAYTSANVWYARGANIFFISDAEVIDRMLINHYFDVIDRTWVIDHERSLFGVRYVDRYGHDVQENKLRRLLGMTEKPIVPLPESAIASVLQRSEQIHRTSFEQNLKRYHVDFLILTSPKVLPGNLEAVIGDYQIHRL